MMLRKTGGFCKPFPELWLDCWENQSPMSECCLVAWELVNSGV